MVSCRFSTNFSTIYQGHRDAFEAISFAPEASSSARPRGGASRRAGHVRLGVGLFHGTNSDENWRLQLRKDGKIDKVWLNLDYS